MCDVVIPDLSSKLEIVIATNGTVYVMKIGFTYFLVMQKRTGFKMILTSYQIWAEYLTTKLLDMSASVPGIYKAL